MTRFTALTAALILSALPVLAADPAPLKQAEASRVLYDTGVATRDPLLVLAAAKMRRGLGLSPPTAWPRMAPRRRRAGCRCDAGHRAGSGGGR